MKYEVADCIYTEEVNERICIEDVSFGLTHLAVALQQPRMSEYLLRKRKTESH